MKAKTHHPVLDHSAHLLKLNSLSEPAFTEKHISNTTANKLNAEFKEWLKTWTYGQNYKIRMLFARCFQLSLNNNVLVNVPFRFTTTDKLDVDHMEPKRIDNNNLDSYFNHPDRDSIINQLGNMMILTSSSNQQKSNQPMVTVFSTLQRIGLSGHFITTKTEEILDQNHSLSSNKIRVPTEQFFNERKQFLIDTFTKAVDVPFS